MLALAMMLQSGATGLAIPDRLTVVQHCTGSVDPADVVVCGRSSDRYRLPLPAERDPFLDARVRGEPGSALSAITPAAPCGIFAGERRCGKVEAARYGYGGGRDPVSLLVKLGTKLLDPDADIAK